MLKAEYLRLYILFQNRFLHKCRKFKNTYLQNSSPPKKPNTKHYVKGLKKQMWQKLLLSISLTNAFVKTSTFILIRFSDDARGNKGRLIYLNLLNIRS